MGRRWIWRKEDSLGPEGKGAAVAASPSCVDDGWETGKVPGRKPEMSPAGGEPKSLGVRRLAHGALQ